MCCFLSNFPEPGVNCGMQHDFVGHDTTNSSSDCLREPSLVLILKWGGELTPAGKIQAEELGKAFRCMYPGGQGMCLSVISDWVFFLFPLHGWSACVNQIQILRCRTEEDWSLILFFLHCLKTVFFNMEWSILVCKEWFIKEPPTCQVHASSRLLNPWWEFFLALNSLIHLLLWYGLHFFWYCCMTYWSSAGLFWFKICQTVGELKDFAAGAIHTVHQNFLKWMTYVVG